MVLSSRIYCEILWASPARLARRWSGSVVLFVAVAHQQADCCDEFVNRFAVELWLGLGFSLVCVLARGFEAIGDLVEPSGEGVGERAVGVVADVPDAGIVDRAVLVEAVDAAPGVDLDGDLDLYVVNYIDFDVDNPPPPSRYKGVEVLAGPHGLIAQHDVLYENAGDGTFRDITASAGC
ncbi:MAG: hypothetical protein IH820_08610, partial [Bacteroidetes bacterium]|nr:hypothetical protein [Bacteroidota bacterium]